MTRKLLIVWLVLLLLPFSALAETYTLAAEGVIFNVTFLPGGDVIQYGSYGRTNADGQVSDTSVMRTRPDGTEVWAFDPPQYLEASIPFCFLSLSDGRFALTYPMGDDDLRAFFLDPEEGLQEEVSLPYGPQGYFAIDGGILETTPDPQTDTLRLRWLDLHGQEVQQKEYPLDMAADASISVLETEDALYVQTYYFRQMKDASAMLVKLTKDGLLQWKLTADSPDGFGYTLQPDGEGGVLLLGDAGMYDDETAYPYKAQRIDAQGDILWQKDVEVGKSMVRQGESTGDDIPMVWETGDTFQFVTLDNQGELQMGDILEKPSAGADIALSICGFTQDTEGRQWVYYITVEDISPYEVNVKPYLVPLEEFGA